VFLTNAILCLKSGGLQAKVVPDWFVNCGNAFLGPTVELVRPRVVVTLGQLAYQAVCRVFRLRPMKFREAVETDAIELKPGCLLVPVYHCGARILNTHRPLLKQKVDWVRVRRAMER
jgi:uracil-DNA glycosylase